MDGGAWQATVHRVAKSWTQLSDFTFTLSQKKNNKKREKGTEIIYKDNRIFEAWGRNYMYKSTKLS